MGFSSLEKLSAETIQKSFKICVLSSSLDGSEEEDLMCIKHGPCQSLLPKLQAIRVYDEEIDPFIISEQEDMEVSEEDMAQEEVEDFLIDDDDDEFIDVEAWLMKHI